MRILLLTSFFISFCICGCSQNNHNFHDPRKISIDPRRWYQLNNTARGFDELFNGKTHEKPNTGWGTILDHYDAYYPLLDGEQMTIDSIEFFDWEGTNDDHPLTIYAILADWTRIPIAVFTGMRYNAWNGPDPQKPDVFALKQPVSGIRYLVINSWGDFPGEIEFYGSYKPPKPTSPIHIHPAGLKNFFGINAFEWDFEEPNDPMHLDSRRLDGIKNFMAIRHYLDWDKIEPAEGQFTFAPARNGGWNYDTIYSWCKMNNIDVLPCIKTVPAWLLDSYPQDQRDNENIPMKYGSNAADPNSYIQQAKAAFQFAARYGSNKSIPASMLHLSADNTARTGMGVIRQVECDNERDKWWKGRKSYQTGREYAANLSAFYDGHKNTMGPGVGVKNADPSMKVVMAGLAAPDPGYVQGMIDWCKEFRGYRPDGTVDLPFDIINYHFYSNDQDYDESKKQTTGIAPEISKAAAVANSFIQMAHQYANDMPVWITEAGYDINQQSPQKAFAIKGKSPEQTQADWILRTSLLYAKAGIQKVFYYELMDDQPNSTNKYGTSGLLNLDRNHTEPNTSLARSGSVPA